MRKKKFNGVNTIKKMENNLFVLDAFVKYKDYLDKYVNLLNARTRYSKTAVKEIFGDLTDSDKIQLWEGLLWRNDIQSVAASKILHDFTQHIEKEVAPSWCKLHEKHIQAYFRALEDLLKFENKLLEEDKFVELKEFKRNKAAKEKEILEKLRKEVEFHPETNLAHIVEYFSIRICPSIKSKLLLLYQLQNFDNNEVWFS